MRLAYIALAVVLLAGAAPTLGSALANESSPAQPVGPSTDRDLQQTRSSLTQAAEDVGEDPDVLDGLELARDALAVQQERLDADSPDGMAEQLQEHRSWTKDVQALVEIVHRSDPGADSAPASLEPSAAAFGLADQVGHTLTAEEKSDLERLDTLKEPWPAQLADWIVAFQAFHAETQAALADLPQYGDVGTQAEVVDRVRAKLQEVDDPSRIDLNAVEPAVADAITAEELSHIHDARNTFLEESLELQDLVAVEQPAGEPDVEVCPVIAVGLSNEATTYEQDCRLVLDLGGPDHYRNNAGGTATENFADGECPEAVPSSLIAAAVVDLGNGEDTYGNTSHPRNCGVNGGAATGSGFILDAGGDDRYVAGQEGVNGAANVGTGAIVDLGGSDTYESEFASNGNGFAGTGLLYDEAGDDRYLTGTGGFSQGIGTAGKGALVDVGGRDYYEAGPSSNGGGPVGSGLLLDVSGSDRYVGSGDGAVNGGALGGSGLLVDVSGHDTIEAGSDYSNGGGSTAATGTLVNLEGDDTYRAEDGGTNGGAVFGGQGLLFDATGNDRYVAGAEGVNGGGSLAAGLLVDGDGQDTYEDRAGGSGTDRSVAPKGTVGAQLDLPHPPTQPDEVTPPPRNDTATDPRPHVVVGDPDTGLNPYHEAYRRPDLTEHPCTYIPDFPCDIPALNLTLDAKNLKTAIQQDLEEWKSVEPGEWYWIPGTSIVAASCDDDGAPCILSCSIEALEENDELTCTSGEHGTHTTSSVLAENPHALIAFRETTGLIESFEDRGIPVDVYTVSWGPPAPVPVPADAGCPGEQEAPIYVTSAGNTPYSTLNSCRKGDPGKFVVGGAYAKDRTEEGGATKNPELVSYYCRPTADDDTLDLYESACGTSFSAPTVAGALSKVILEIREHTGYTGNLDGQTVDPLYGEDGLTVGELREAMNRTATYNPEPRYDATDTSGSVPLNPLAPWLQWGWGFYDGRIANATLDHFLEEPVPPRPLPVRTYMDAQHTVKTGLYGDRT